ncbi:DivIVA domain-containing protein [Facklamia sp. DSM 111018]|uniref:DivIVA domain-containing protein n=1 Tax=Facklamia lactis TaxID=2749967 RepID=A0ABS0LRF1_9LACT|nr:DivIVA domain-containing protein [Facklamia lactis]MBG9980904.1 DivIVA domain-containing protein [Facklamia lactis]MBG9986733.1 DivIVA domain-containing protein [Facklamia lactis]
MERISEVSVNIFGYNRKQVNQLVEYKDQQIKELESKQNTLEQKLQAMEEKLHYYQSIESALKDGLVDARKTGNEIISDSEEEAEKILARTNEQVAQYKENLSQYSRELVTTGVDLKERFVKMQNQMLGMVQEYEEFISQTNFESVFPSKQVNRFMDQVDHYEKDKDLEVEQAKAKSMGPENQLSEEEKQELQRLIQEVIQNESGAKVKDDKLVDFKRAQG